MALQVSFFNQVVNSGRDIHSGVLSSDISLTDLTLHRYTRVLKC